MVVFIAMGKSANDKEQVSLSDFIDMLSAGVGSIAKRGKASAGDKTMLDSLLPGIEFLQKNVDQLPMDELFENMIAEMQKGSDAVIHLVAKKEEQCALASALLVTKIQELNQPFYC
jgi:dihydroxyacetone kinase-like protein